MLEYAMENEIAFKEKNEKVHQNRKMIAYTNFISGTRGDFATIS